MRDFLKVAARFSSAVAAVTFLTACGPSLPDRLQHARTSAYVFHHPASEVELAARNLLRNQGFEVQAGDRPGVVRTEWRALIDDEQFATEYARYIVIVQRLSPEHCRVAALKMTAATLGMETAHPHTQSSKDGGETNGNTATYGKGTVPLLIGTPTARRDLDLEWGLITFEEPERARIVLSDIAWQLAHR